jgi:selenocysteine-specific elongation factor
MHVISTAGHVDHGKSSLVKALTGIDPDRLKEEKERQMTIDLGFAWLSLPSGIEVGIVDVPGHTDFMENMLAGMPGVDLVLLVIALDEGVMPQTREHLSVLDLMAIKSGIIVLTKADLVNDQQWVDMVRSDIRQLTVGTFLENSPMQPVSVKTRSGIEDLILKIDDLIKKLPERPDFAKPRLAIDRVFTLTGFGTVVTGTLLDGQFKTGDEVEILPSGLKARIRGLQTHKHKQDTSFPGSRTAVNLSGLSVEQLHRGDVLVHPSTYRSSALLQVSFQLLADVPDPLKNNQEIKLFLGSAEINAKSRIMTKQEIQPGSQSILQLELSRPTIAVRGDRFILRRPSPPLTLGGGEILDAHPTQWSKKSSRLRTDESNGTKLDRLEAELLQFLHKNGVQSFSQIKTFLNQTDDEVKNHILALLEEKKLITLGPEQEKNLQMNNFIEAGYLHEVSGKIETILINIFRENNLRIGVKKEELRSKLALSTADFGLVLKYLLEQEILNLRNGLVTLPSRKIQFSPKQEGLINELLNRFDKSSFETPSVEECVEMVGKDVYQSLLDQQILLQVSPQIVFRSEIYKQMVEHILTTLQEKGKITLAEVRDHFHTSRKYTLAVLEHLDRQGITIREEDYRKLK